MQHYALQLQVVVPDIFFELIKFLVINSDFYRVISLHKSHRFSGVLGALPLTQPQEILS
jgi:hypothetical protein